MKLSTVAKNIVKSTDNIISLVVDAILKASIDGKTELLVPNHRLLSKAYGITNENIAIVQDILAKYNNKR